MLDGHFGLAHVGLLRGRNHLQAAVIGIFLGSLGGGLRCHLPLLIVAVGFNNLLIATNGVFIAKVKYLAEGLDRLLCPRSIKPTIPRSVRPFQRRHFACSISARAWARAQPSAIAFMPVASCSRFLRS